MLSKMPDSRRSESHRNHCKAVIIPKTWAVRGSTAVSLDCNPNTNKDEVTTFHPFEQMSLTIKPRTKRVKIFFSASGEGGTFGDSGSPNLPAPQQAVDFQLVCNGIGLNGYGATTMLTDTDTNAGANPPFSRSLSSWNAQIIVPLSVSPGVSTTISINWKTYFITNLQGPSTIVYNDVVTKPNSHRALMIEELVD